VLGRVFSGKENVTTPHQIKQALIEMHSAMEVFQQTVGALIRVLAALPNSTDSYEIIIGLWKIINPNCNIYPDYESIDKSLVELHKLGYLRSIMFVFFRRTKAGDDALAALQDWEAV